MRNSLESILGVGMLVKSRMNAGRHAASMGVDSLQNRLYKETKCGLVEIAQTDRGT